MTDIITKQDAISKGLDFYFTGKPCKRGHIAKRNVSKSMCTGCFGSLTPNDKRKESTFEKIKEIAIKKGGKCISNEYLGSKQKLKFICKFGHQFSAQAGWIKQTNGWCSKCKGGVQKYSVIDCINLAKKRGGKFLSKKYDSVDSVYLWECNVGHQFKNQFKKIQQGQWCGICSKSHLKEEMCRVIFESLFKTKFIKEKHSWLLNTKGNKMELDGFSKSLNIAFEFQGQQHHQTNFFIKNKSQLKIRKIDDNIKVDECRKRNIKLFVIEDFNDASEVISQIKKQITILKINSNLIKLNTKINLNKVYFKENKIDQIIKLGKLKNYVLNDTNQTWLGMDYKYELRCLNDGHIWKARGKELIINSSGCKKCSMRSLQLRNTKTIDEIIDYANNQNGSLLSKHYLKNNSVYKFQCEKNHIFFDIFANMKNRNTWCVYCTGNKYRIGKQYLLKQKYEQQR